MKSDDFLLAISAIAVVLSVVGLTVTYNSVTDFENLLTGYFIEEGFVNVTLSSNAAINISSAAGSSGIKTINWGAGSVDPGQSHAVLSTVGSGTVVNSSTWTPIGGGFIIDNIGNVNVTLAIHANVDAAGLFDGTGPGFQYNLSDSLPGSCNDYVATFEQTFKEFTTSAVTACNNFSKDSGLDQLLLDIKLIIPGDATSGQKDATVTLTYSGV